MFDIGFFELVVIGVVGLLVIGPERLPETLRTLALWWGRLKRGIQNTRTEFEQQIGADDIRRQLHNEDIMQRLNSSKDEISRAVSENVDDIQNSMNEISGSLKDIDGSASGSSIDNTYLDNRDLDKNAKDKNIYTDDQASSPEPAPQEDKHEKPSDTGRH